MRRFNFLAIATLGGALAMFITPAPVCAQQPAPAPTAMPGMNMGGPSGIINGTTNDLFVMLGSDFDRPGLLPRSNYNIGLGHMFGFLKKDPFGDELTFGYMYENSATHGFFHTAFGEHTESVGVMRNFPIPATKLVTGYTWIQTGITSFTGNARLQNRLDSGVSLGAMIHFSRHSSVWLQESYGKVVTVPWFTTSSVGYTWSW